MDRQTRLTRSKASRADWRTRSKYVTLTLEPEDFELLVSIAEREGVKPASFAGHIVRSTAKDLPLLPNAIGDARSDLRQLVCSCANNARQLERHSARFKARLKTTGYFPIISSLMDRFYDSVESRYKRKRVTRKK